MTKPASPSAAELVTAMKARMAGACDAVDLALNGPCAPEQDNRDYGFVVIAMPAGGGFDQVLGSLQFGSNILEEDVLVVLKSLAEQMEADPKYVTESEAAQ